MSPSASPWYNSSIWFLRSSGSDNFNLSLQPDAPRAQTWASTVVSGRGTKADSSRLKPTRNDNQQTEIEALFHASRAGSGGGSFDFAQGRLAGTPVATSKKGGTRVPTSKERRGRARRYMEFAVGFALVNIYLSYT